MDEQRQDENQCAWGKDAQDQADLCCCYALDPDDDYVDPCYDPADECCC